MFLRTIQYHVAIFWLGAVLSELVGCSALAQERDPLEIVAARQGATACQAYVGGTYIGTVEGVSSYIQLTDKEKIEFIKRSADSGHPTGLLFASILYYKDAFAEKNSSIAFQYAMKAADLGNREAAYIVGEAYFNGVSVNINKTVAARYYRNAAELGLFDAQVKLAGMYFSGIGVIEDKEEALKWGFIAAENAPDDSSRNTLQNIIEQSRKDFALLGQPEAPIRAKRNAANFWEERPADSETLYSECVSEMANLDAQSVTTNYEWGNKSLAVFSLEAVETIQLGLSALGYETGPIDGVLGEQTRNAIEAFERDIGDEPTGEPSAELSMKIGAALALANSDDGPPSTSASVISTGSGLAISSEGHVVTNAHVADECDIVQEADGKPLTLLSIESASDLALLKRDRPSEQYARLRSGRGVRQGDDVIVVGFPLQGILSSGPSVTLGTVSALAGPGDDRRFFQISAAVQPGNSGGPVLDEQGALVGVVFSKLDASSVLEATGSIPENVNFAIAQSTLEGFLESHGVDYVFADAIDESIDRADVVAHAREFTVMLECVMEKH